MKIKDAVKELEEIQNRLCLIRLYVSERPALRLSQAVERITAALVLLDKDAAKDSK